MKKSLYKSCDNEIGMDYNTIFNLEFSQGENDFQVLELEFSARHNSDSSFTISIYGATKEQLKLMSKVFAEAAKKAKY